MEDENKAQEAKAASMVEAVWKDKKATINGRDYVFTNTTHEKRKRIFAFYTSIVGQLDEGVMSFMATKEFDEVEKLVDNMVTYEGQLLSKLKPGHWDAYPEDYVKFVCVALAAISFPLLRGVRTA